MKMSEQVEGVQSSSGPTKGMPLSVTFVHPDLGIGGAERLIVDAAVGMKRKGHNVRVYTSYHDSNRSFPETNDGTLDVKVYGGWIPRNTFGKFHIFWATLKALYLAICIAIFEPESDVIFCDQVSTSIPILKCSTRKILYYGHFPDKLLTQRLTSAKKMYRVPFDWLEEITTGMADEIVVNSKFTATVFKQSFPSITKSVSVLYPAINFSQYDGDIDLNDVRIKPLVNNKIKLLSINRFERKKDLHMTIELLQWLKAHLPAAKFSHLQLILAGGYDPRVSENVEYLLELQELAKSYSFTYVTLFPDTPSPTELIASLPHIVFIPSFSTQRNYLLRSSFVLLYTPKNEHFGIVPLESMYSRLPVIAWHSGGPIETVCSANGIGKTGWLVKTTDGVEGWGKVILSALEMNENFDVVGAILDHVGLTSQTAEKAPLSRSRGKAYALVGEQGRTWVKQKFSLDAFVEQLEVICHRLLTCLPPSSVPTLVKKQQ